MLTAIATGWRAFGALPKWAHGLLAAAVLALAWTLWLRSHDKAVIAKHEATIAAQQDEIMELAAKAAAAASTRVRDDASDAVRRSQEAAATADDPLAAGRRELR